MVVMEEEVVVEKNACCGPLGPQYCIQYIQGAWDITATCGEYVREGENISTTQISF
jgi:hypothetical protein